ncbi:hypothetical protein Dip510_000754 [Elusimicrobium posterum]|uniref:hypothetical protein n=1 Tax=Elusimicrobium posterum TaxID=3116653 RepID=UPI003C716F1E
MIKTSQLKTYVKCNGIYEIMLETVGETSKEVSLQDWEKIKHLIKTIQDPKDLTTLQLENILRENCDNAKTVAYMKKAAIELSRPLDIKEKTVKYFAAISFFVCWLITTFFIAKNVSSLGSGAFTHCLLSSIIAFFALGILIQSVVLIVQKFIKNK